MKLHTSFIASRTRLVPILAISSWICLSVCLLLSIYLMLSARAFNEKNELLLQEQARLQDKASSPLPRNSQQATQDDFIHLQGRIAGINQLTEMNGVDLSLTLAQLERRIPDRSYLLSLNYRAVSGEVSLVIESPEVSKLTNFVDQLEADELFDEVSIVRQDDVSRGGESAAQIEIRLIGGSDQRMHADG